MCFMGKKTNYYHLAWHDFKPDTKQNSHMRIPLSGPIYLWMEDIMSQLVDFSMVYLYWNWSWVLPRSIPKGLIFL